MRTTFVALLVGALMLGCDSQTTDTAPADYERAKADCTPHGGLLHVTTVWVILHDDRVDATCKDKARISRVPLPQQENSHE